MKFRTVGLLAVAAFATVTAAFAQRPDYPERNITVIVPFPPGGASDITARLVTPKLAERMKQSVVIDNRAGANGAHRRRGAEAGAPPTAIRCWSVRSACSRSIPRCSRTSATIRRRISTC